MLLEAPAKVNLFLEVIAKRKDNYHQIQTVMHTIDLCDRITIIKSRRNEITVDPSIPNNSVLKAAQLFFTYTGIKKKGVHIHIKKKTPPGAGLGGGSSNAAATLLGLNSLFKTGLDETPLHELACNLGSDTPFFLRQGTCLCTGRGEIVSRINFKKKLYFVLLYPGFESSTQRVYSSRYLNLTKRPKDAIKFIKLLTTCDINELGAGLFNRLEQPAFKMMRKLARIKNIMKRVGFLGILMTGSGSCLYGLCESKEEAIKKGKILKGMNVGQIFVQSSWI